MTALDDAAKAYRDACRDRDACERAYRDASVTKDILFEQQEQAQARANMARKFLSLVAQHGPVEDWGRDYMADEAPKPQNFQQVSNVRNY